MVGEDTPVDRLTLRSAAPANIYMACPPIHVLGATCTAYRGSFAAQRVQMQLKSAEQTQKDDSSPVTVADYGAACGDSNLKPLP